MNEASVCVCVSQLVPLVDVFVRHPDNSGSRKTS